MRAYSALASLIAAILLTLSFTSWVAADAFADRTYHLGDDAFENGSVGAIVGAGVAAPFNDGRTIDSAGSSGSGDFQDLLRPPGSNGPVYSNTTGRPGVTASTNLGLRFDGLGDGLGGRELNSPNVTWAELADSCVQDGDCTYPHNWTNIFARGTQVWVRPEAATGNGTAGLGGGLRQDIVTDTGEHGIYISESGNWGLQFDDNSIESSVVAIAGDWTHVMERSLSGAFGGALLVNGVAVAARGTFYDDEAGDMSVGANQNLDGNFFKGELDELSMFLWGDNSSIAGGTIPDQQINMATDNDWIRQQLASLGVTNPADVNLDTSIDNNDVSTFITNWRNSNLVDGVAVGDWTSRQNGDLNFDGTVNMADAFILHEGLVAATGVGLNFNALVPEPHAGMMFVIGILGCVASRRRRHRPTT